MAEAGVPAAQAALGQCESFCANSSACAACSVDCSLGSMTVCQWVAIPECGNVDSWDGLIPGDIS